MNKQAFYNGFLNRATQYGISPDQATALYKAAISKEDEEEVRAANHPVKDSSMIGRYLDTKAQRHQAFNEHPFLGTIGGRVGGIAGGLGGAALGGLGGAGIGALLSAANGQDVGEGAKQLGTGGAALGGALGLFTGGGAGGALGSQGLDKNTRNETLKDIDDKLTHRTIGDNALHSAKNVGLLGAALGGIFGAGHDMSNGAPGSDGLRSILQGAAAGGLGGAAFGGLSGGLNSFIHKGTSDETHHRTRKLLAKHPVQTALPGGGIVGSANA